LADEQFATFLTRLKTLQAARRRSENQRNRALMELRRFVQSEAPGAAAADEGVRARLKALDDAEAQGTADVRQARTGVDQILTPRQQARFRLLEEQIERRKLELFARSRRSLPPQ
jgi:Spy/CpxP family protein refolding chaperone